MTNSVHLSDELGTSRSDDLAPDIPSRAYWGPGRVGTAAGIVIRFVVFLIAMFVISQTLNARGGTANGPCRSRCAHTDSDVE